MKTPKIKFVLAFVLLALTIPGASLARSPASDSEVPLRQWVRLNAYTHTHLFNDPPWEPHYGACFHGCWGYDPHYTGPGGDGATCGYGCIWTWDWWPGYDECLLTPKIWLGWPSMDSDRTTASNYNAIVHYAP